MGSKKIVSIDGLLIGANNPVRVESMLKTPLTEINSCFTELESLADEGCELVRVSFPSLDLSDNFSKLIRQCTRLKIMADIHFSHKLALAALKCGSPSIRINPGNMTDRDGLTEVISLAKETGSVIRIGANGGSLNNRQIKEAGGDRAKALAAAVEEQIKLLNENAFDNMIISAKSSSVTETVRANAILAQKYDYPIHIGITEAGSGVSGVVKGALGIGVMLSQGIGDTVRVSLTEPGTEEVKTAYHILRSLEIRKHGYNFISCPTCGRKRVDVASLSEIVKSLLPNDIPDGMTIAVMGCEVNGPKEASGADLGIAGTPDGFVMFRKGKHMCSGRIEQLEDELKKIIKTLRDCSN